MSPSNSGKGSGGGCVGRSNLAIVNMVSQITQPVGSCACKINPQIDLIWKTQKEFLQNFSCPRGDKSHHSHTTSCVKSGSAGVWNRTMSRFWTYKVCGEFPSPSL